MIQPGIYKFKEELWTMLEIPKGQWERRKDDLLKWFTNFFDYELINGRPLMIKINEVYGEYQSLPRKMDGYNMEEKIVDYEKFTVAALGTEFKPNSKTKVAREAINSFGKRKYNHTSQEAVARRFISPAFEKYGESDGVRKWVWYTTYELLSEEVVADWRKIMSEEHISEEEAANAFYRQELGEDISKEKQYFANARARFVDKYGEFPILVESWKVKG